jgi:hypothetical protein
LGLPVEPSPNPSAELSQHDSDRWGDGFDPGEICSGIDYSTPEHQHVEIAGRAVTRGGGGH